MSGLFVGKHAYAIPVHVIHACCYWYHGQWRAHAAGARREQRRGGDAHARAADAEVHSRTTHLPPTAADRVYTAADLRDRTAFHSLLSTLPLASPCRVVVSRTEDAPSLWLQRFAIACNTEMRLRKVLPLAEGRTTVVFRCARGTNVNARLLLPVAVPGLPAGALPLPGTYRQPRHGVPMELHHYHVNAAGEVGRCATWRQAPHDVGCPFTVHVTLHRSQPGVLVIDFPSGIANHSHPGCTLSDAADARMDVDVYKDLHPDAMAVVDLCSRMDADSTLAARMVNAFCGEFHGHFVTNPYVRSGMPVAPRVSAALPEYAVVSRSAADDGTVEDPLMTLATAATADEEDSDGEDDGGGAGAAAAAASRTAPRHSAVLADLQLCARYSSYRWSVDTATVTQLLQHKREAARGHTSSWRHCLLALPRYASHGWLTMSLYVHTVQSRV